MQNDFFQGAYIQVYADAVFSFPPILQSSLPGGKEGADKY